MGRVYEHVESKDNLSHFIDTVSLVVFKVINRRCLGCSDQWKTAVTKRRLENTRK